MHQPALEPLCMGQTYGSLHYLDVAINLCARVHLGLATDGYQVAVDVSPRPRFDITHYCDGGVADFSLDIQVAADGDGRVAHSPTNNRRAANDNDRLGSFTFLQFHVMADRHQRITVDSTRTPGPVGNFVCRCVIG